MGKRKEGTDVELEFSHRHFGQPQRTTAARGDLTDSEWALLCSIRVGHIDEGERRFGTALYLGQACISFETAQ
jgi:hypothetical protein